MIRRALAFVAALALAGCAGLSPEQTGALARAALEAAVIVLGPQ